MRRPRAFERRSLIAVAAVALCGCTLVTSLTGLSDGDAPSAPADASPEAVAAGDTGTPSEAGADAVEEAAVDAGPFCARVDATVCEDFEDPVAAGRWNLSFVGNAVHGIDGDASTSAPFSLFAGTTALADGANATSYRYIRLPRRVTSVAYAFDLRIDRRAERALVVASASLEDTADGGSGFAYRAAITVGNLDDNIEESREGATNSYLDRELSPRIAIGKWTRVAVSVTRQPNASYRALVTLDGVAVVDTPLTLWTGFSDGTPVISIGALYTSGPTSPWAIRVDSVTFDVK
jgi:hypothetical protein